MKTKLLIGVFLICGIAHAQNISGDSIQNTNFQKHTIGFGAVGGIGLPFLRQPLSSGNVPHTFLYVVNAVNLYYKSNVTPNRSFRVFLQIEKYREEDTFVEANVVSYSENSLPNNELHINSDVSIEEAAEALYSGLSFGYQFDKRFKKWNLFYGADVLGGYFKSEKIYTAQQEFDYYIVNSSAPFDRTLIGGSTGKRPGVTIEEKSIRAGVAPFVGLEFYINKNISFFSQIEIAFAAQINSKIEISKQELSYSPDANEYNNRLYTEQTLARNNKDIVMAYLISPSLIGFNFHF